MNAELVGRHYEIEDEVREYAEERLEATSRFARNPIHAHVVFTAEGHRCIVDVQFSHRGESLHAKEEADDMREAANLAFDKLDKQLRRSRKRNVDKRRRADHERAEADHWHFDVVAGDDLRSGETSVLRSSQFDIEEMDMNEAVARLEGSRNEFLIFRLTDTGSTTVLYKREDGNYGITSPEV